MPPACEQRFVVSDELLENLAELRVDYASLLYEYKNVLESSPEGQKKLWSYYLGCLVDHSDQITASSHTSAL